MTEGWDGSDVFWSRGKADRSFIATDRIVRAFQEAELVGYEIEPSTTQQILIG